jgi:hypothetical protein
MKMKLLLLTALAGMFLGPAYAVNVTSVEIDRSTLAVATSDIIDTEDFNTLSIQLIYSTANPQAKTIYCGISPFVRASVIDWRWIQARASTMTFTIPFTQSRLMDVSTPVLTINGKEFTYGVHWSSGITSTNTIISLRNAVTTYSNGEYTATASSNVLTIWAASSGTYANSWYATSSSATVVNVGTSTTSGWRAPFVNGNNRGYVTINNETLYEGTSFYALTSNAITAKNISNAMAAHNPYANTIISSHSGSIIYTTAAYNTDKFFSYSFSTGIVITEVSTLSMTSNISVAADTVTIRNNNFTTGLPVLLSTQAPNLMPTGLRSTATYFIYSVSDSAFKIAPTRIAASTGGFIDITDINVNNSSITVTPIAFLNVGTAGFKWQASNDGSTWADFNASSVTSTSMASSSSTLWGLGVPSYRYLRGSYSPALYGGHNIKAIFYGRQE